MAQMEKGESCGACHNGTKAFAIEKCGGCHPTPREIVFKVRETGPTIFHHEEHAASFNCAACHDKLYVIGAKKHLPMAAMEKGKSCGACHNKKEAFAINSCQKCHPVKEIHFKVEGAGNVKFSHSAHLGMYSCRDCHSAIFPAKISTRAVSMSEMEKGKSCGACHDGKTAFSVKEKCDSCHASG
jgi:c(7)-type cytochrome triheme protein